MKKLFYSLLFIIFVGGALFVAGPFGIGYLLEKQYPNMIKKFSATDPGIKVSLVEFKRDWFKSTAKLKVTLTSRWLTVPGKPNDENTFIVNQQISQGPVILLRNVKNQLRPQFGLAHIESTTDADNIQFNASTLIGFSGSLTSNFTMPTLNIANQNQAFSLSNASGWFRYSYKHDKLDYRLQIANGRIRNNTTTLAQPTGPTLTTLSNVRSTGKFNKQHNIWYGHREIRMAKLNYRNEARKITRMDNIDFKVDHLDQGKTSAIKVRLKANNVASGEKEFGQVTFAFTIDDLNNSAFSDLAQQFVLLNKEPNAPLQTTLAKLQPSALQLLGQGFTVKLNKLKIDTQDGQLSMKAKALLPKQLDQANLAYSLQNAQARAQASVPKNWLLKWLREFYRSNSQPKSTQYNRVPPASPMMRAQKTIQQWLQHRILESDGNRFSLKLYYQNGGLKINNHPMHWQTLLNGGAQQPKINRVVQRPPQPTLNTMQQATKPEPTQVRSESQSLQQLLQEAN